MSFDTEILNLCVAQSFHMTSNNFDPLHLFACAAVHLPHRASYSANKSSATIVETPRKDTSYIFMYASNQQDWQAQLH